MRMCCVSFETQNVTVISDIGQSEPVAHIHSPTIDIQSRLTSHYHDVNVEVDTDFVNRKQVHQKYTYYYKGSGLSS